MNSTSPHTPPDTEEKCVSGPGAAPSLRAGMQDPRTGFNCLLTGDPSPGGKVSYWRYKTSEEQPPDIEGTMDEVRAFIEGTQPMAVIFDTSDLTRSPSGHTPTWKGRQRHLDQKLQPRVLHEQWTSRKDRRATGDRRTAQQIAESIRAGQERS